MTTEQEYPSGNYPKMDAPRRRRRRLSVPSPYDLRQMAHTFIYLAALAGLLEADIWLAGKL